MTYPVTPLPSRRSLEAYLHEHIPITRAMQVGVVAIDPGQARLAAAGLPSRLVIQRNSMEFLAPIPADFTATARLADPAAGARFEQMLRRKGRARIATVATLECQGATVGKFEGEFVAVLAASTAFTASA